MSIYYFYRMTSDTGNAPCVFETKYKETNLLTLACCKGGQIRYSKNGAVKLIRTGLRYHVGERFNDCKKKCKNEEIYVIGIMKDIDGDRVVYAAKIDDVIKMTDYSSCEKYINRKDCIYELEEWADTDGEWNLKRREGFNLSFHGKKSFTDNNELINQNHRDELGTYVLKSNDFIYQGSDAGIKIAGDMKEFIPKRQETKRYEDGVTAEKDLSIIRSFVEKCFREGKKKEFLPTEKLDDGSCSKGGCQK